MMELDMANPALSVQDRRDAEDSIATARAIDQVQKARHTQSKDKAMQGIAPENQYAAEQDRQKAMQNDDATVLPRRNW